MVTSTCSCEDDFVSLTLADLIAAVRCEDRTLDALRLAQKRLVGSIVPRSNETILWTQTYLHPESALLEAAQGEDNVAGPLDGIVSSAADICVPDGTAEAFYGPFKSDLDSYLRGIPKAQQSRHSLSLRFGEAGTPPVASIWLRDDQLCSDWNELDTSVLPAHIYKRLFADGRSDGLYVHIAYPFRRTPLTSSFGPAGCYVFLKHRNVNLPECFFWHMQMFVQAIVTEQHWSLATRLQKALVTERSLLRQEQGRLKSRQQALHDNTEWLRRGYRVVARIAKEAENLVHMADPLHRSITAFDAAQQHAKAMFETKPLPEHQTEAAELHRNLRSRLHDVSDWLTIPASAEGALLALVKKLHDEVAASRKLTPRADTSVALVETLANEIHRSAVAGNIELALRHAKALDRHSICVSTGSGTPKTIQPKFNGRGVHLGPYHLRQAVVQLMDADLKGTVSFQDISTGGRNVSVACIEYPFDADALHADALVILNDEGSDRLKTNAEALARILRGLRGGGELDGYTEEERESIKSNASWVDGTRVLIRCSLRDELEGV